MGEKRHLTARIDADVIDALRQWAAGRDTSVSAAMEELIVAGLASAAGDSGADSGAEEATADREATTERGGADSALVASLRAHIDTLQSQLDRTNAQLDAALDSVRAAQVLQIRAASETALMAETGPRAESGAVDPTQQGERGQGATERQTSTGAQDAEVETEGEEPGRGGFLGWLRRFTS